MKAETYSVGQVLYYRPRDPRRREEVLTITGIGRKWLTVATAPYGADPRVDKDTLAVDGGRDHGSPGQCYRSEQALAEAKEVERLWAHLRHEVGAWVRPKGQVDSHALRRAIGILGLKQPDPAP